MPISDDESEDEDGGIITMSQSEQQQQQDSMHIECTVKTASADGSKKTRVRQKYTAVREFGGVLLMMPEQLEDLPNNPEAEWLAIVIPAGQ
ncbi:hypothetical protein EV182_006017, partial [Spiromyces aspiralis]